MEIFGKVATGFEKVQDAFNEALEHSHGKGCALSIRQDGSEVVNLWGGHAEVERLWERETPSIIFSSTKGLLSILAGMLVDQGKLDLDATVASYWPEFAQKGKDLTTVRQALSHKAGLSALTEALNLDQVLHWETMVEKLESAQPIFTPGQGHQYHAITFGWLIGEILHRASGLGLRALFEKLIKDPLGVDAWIGASDEALIKAAHLYPSPDNPLSIPESSEHWAGIRKYELTAMTLGNAFPAELSGDNTGFNDDRVRKAEIGGAGGLASAEALATIWSATVSDYEKVRLLSDEVIADMSVVQSSGMPNISMDPPFPSWGSGFMLSTERRHFLTDRSFGHDGFGGQVTFADPTHKIGFAFITNDLQTENDDRAELLVRVLRETLHKKPKSWS